MTDRGTTVGVLGALIVVGMACGGGRPLPTALPPPTPTPAPAPTPTPTPEPTPTPAPAATPSPCTAGLCEDPVTNSNPVVRLTLRVYFVEDREGRLTELGVDDFIPVGHLIHIDATAKDADNKETNGRGDAVRFFLFGDESLVAMSGNHPFQRKLRVLAPGSVEIEGELERVRSNRLKLKLG